VWLKSIENEKKNETSYEVSSLNQKIHEKTNQVLFNSTWFILHNEVKIKWNRWS
jgi:hypothetical protein